MKLTQKFSDFLRLEEAQGHLPKLAGMGVAVASSIAVNLLAPTIALGACIHGDYYSDHLNKHADVHSDVVTGYGGWEYYTDYSNGYVGCISG